MTNSPTEALDDAAQVAFIGDLIGTAVAPVGSTITVFLPGYAVITGTLAQSAVSYIRLNDDVFIDRFEVLAFRVVALPSQRGIPLPEVTE